MAIPRDSKYTDESEFGGRNGIIQAEADGHALMTARENRMVHRVWGGRTAGVMTDLPETDLHFDSAAEILTDLPFRTNHRTPEEQPTEQIG